MRCWQNDSSAEDGLAVVEYGRLAGGDAHDPVGAAADTAFQHIAIEVPGTNESTEWCEAVDPAEYAKLGSR